MKNFIGRIRLKTFERIFLVEIGQGGFFKPAEARVFTPSIELPDSFNYPSLHYPRWQNEP